MPERSRTKRPRDLNRLASKLLKVATEGESTPEETAKNPAAVELGRLGGLKGGKARAAKLTRKKRREIARFAAHVRWEKRRRD